MPQTLVQIDSDVLKEMRTQTGESLFSLCCRQPILLVFLRHFGCVFCKEALDDLSERRQTIQDSGIQLIFVHMADNETAEQYFKRFRLEGVLHISDTGQRYYRAFGLQRGSFGQLYGLRTLLRGFQLKQERGYELELAKKLGDSTQMPGVFVLQNGRIVESYIHRFAADRPDYDKLVACCVV